MDDKYNEKFNEVLDLSARYKASENEETRRNLNKKIQQGFKELNKNISKKDKIAVAALQELEATFEKQSIAITKHDEKLDAIQGAIFGSNANAIDEDKIQRKMNNEPTRPNETNNPNDAKDRELNDRLRKLMHGKKYEKSSDQDIDEDLNKRLRGLVYGEKYAALPDKDIDKDLTSRLENLKKDLPLQVSGNKESMSSPTMTEEIDESLNEEKIEASLKEEEIELDRDIANLENNLKMDRELDDDAILELDDDAILELDDDAILELENGGMDKFERIYGETSEEMESIVLDSAYEILNKAGEDFIAAKEDFKKNVEHLNQTNPTVSNKAILVSDVSFICNDSENSDKKSIDSKNELSILTSAKELENNIKISEENARKKKEKA